MQWTMTQPEGWETVEVEEPGVLFACRLDAGDGFSPNVVLSEGSQGTDDLRSWQIAVDQMLAERLDGYLCLSLERTALVGQDGVRRVATYTDHGFGRALVQYGAIVDGAALSLTGTVMTLDLPDALPLFDAVAQSLSVTSS